MKKRLFSLALAICLSLSLLPGAALAAGVTATPSATKLMVNGKAVSADAYLINQNNYIKLRDLATMINGTGKNFEVKWDGAKNAINLLSATGYTPAKGDMTPGDGKSKPATPSTSKIYVDGVEAPLKAYLIGQNNYFQLRDVMKTFNVYVGWDGATGTATLDTSKGYELPAELKANLQEKNIEGHHFNNALYHDYIRRGTGEGRGAYHANIPSSFLLQTDDGGFMRVEFDLGEVGKEWFMAVNYYDKDMKLLSTKSIPQELDICGGFYAGKNNYFMLSAENNEELNDKKETYRVTKYDKNWTRLGQISFSDTYTSRAFKMSNASMVENDGKLYIHTGQTMYPDQNSVRHQADLTLVADLATMKPCGMCNFETALKTGNRDGAFVGHSFNQLLLEVDGEVYTASHGDGYPRSMQVSKRNLADIAQGNTSAPFLPFWGDIGNNNTGAELGGLEASSSSILTVGTTRDQNVINAATHDGRLNNVFVAVSPRSNIKAGTTITYLTDCPRGGYCAGNPFLVKLSSDRFMLLWNEKPAVNDMVGYLYNYNMFNAAPVLCYTYLDGKGAQITPIVKTRGELSDCQPILTTDGRVVWTAPREGQQKFFSIQVPDLSAMQPVTPGTGSDTIVKNEWEPGWNTISTGGNYLYVNSNGKVELNSAGKSSPLLIKSLGNMSITIQTPDLKYLAHEGFDPKDFAKIILTDKPFQWNVHRQPDSGKYISPWTSSNRYLYFDGKTADGSLAMITKDIYRYDRQSDRCPFQFNAASAPTAQTETDNSPGPLKDGQYVIGLIDNFLAVNATGGTELRSSAGTTQYKLTGKGGKRYTIQTADGKYLAPDGAVKNSTKLVTSSNEFIWNLYPEKDNKYNLRAPEATTHAVCSSEGRNQDGTPLIFWDYSKTLDAPRHAEFSFISKEAGSSMISYRKKFFAYVVNVSYQWMGGYSLSGVPYFDIADIARLLAETDKKFNFTVDKEKNTLNIISGGTFTSKDRGTVNLPGEVEDRRKRKTYPTSITVLLDGVKREMVVYEIEGMYCMPLYSLTEALNVNLRSERETFWLDTSLPYETEPAVDTPAGALKDGQYTIGLLDNALNVNAAGSAELQESAETTRYKLTGKGDNRYTIQTADGRYLAPNSAVKNGTRVVAASQEFIWQFYPEGGNKYSLRAPDAAAYVVNASGEKRDNGTPIILWEYKASTNAPAHA
ncbi:MAG: hypothetical protein RR211_04945, partial [Pseudoflavonifractor sp.]